MTILLYNPDNGITRNFMPHLWMFLLQALTPKQHQVMLINGNAKAMTRAELVEFCKRENIGLTKADFNPIRTARYTAELRKQLGHVTLAGSGENIKVEIIPFEVLWEIMMKAL